MQLGPAVANALRCEVVKWLCPMNRCRQPYIVAALALKEAGYDVLILGTSDGEGMAKMLGGKCTNGGW